MNRPWILFVGSLFNNDRDEMCQAAQELAEAAASAQVGVLLCSWKEGTIDAEVLRGLQAWKQENPGKEIFLQLFLELGNTPPPEVNALSPLLHQFPAFEEQNVSALSFATAMIAMGGKDNTRTLGMMALKREIPLIALPEWGGAAMGLHDLAEQNYPRRDVRLVPGNSDWDETSAGRIIALVKEMKLPAPTVGMLVQQFGPMFDDDLTRVFSLAAGAARWLPEADRGLWSGSLFRGMRSPSVKFRKTIERLPLALLPQPASEHDKVPFEKLKSSPLRCSSWLVSGMEAALREKGTSARLTPRDVFLMTLASSKSIETRKILDAIKPDASTSDLEAWLDQANAPPPPPPPPPTPTPPTPQPPPTVQLRKILAKLYDDTESIRQLCEDVGLNMSKIDFQGSVTLVWASALKEAEKSEMLTALFEAARKEYPNSKKLEVLKPFFPAGH